VKLTLPPRVSAASFDRALAGFERVVGKGWVRAIVRLANEFKTPLRPTSRGKHLGYGTGAGPSARRVGAERQTAARRIAQRRIVPLGDGLNW
jgi:hypothetical protein